MSFPWADYDAVLAQARAIIQEKDSMGRNSHVGFYETRCHGAQDMSGECWQRITRIIGAEKAGDASVVRTESLDLVNEAILHMMFLLREQAAPALRLPAGQEPDPFNYAERPLARTPLTE